MIISEPTRHNVLKIVIRSHTDAITVKEETGLLAAQIIIKVITGSDIVLLQAKQVAVGHAKTISESREHSGNFRAHCDRFLLRSYERYSMQCVWDN